MCTIVAAFGLRVDAPLVLLANRDEAYGRPSLPPRVIEAGLVGGVDVAARGTWLGVTKGGFVVGVTNQHTTVPPDPDKRSRGQLVLELLRAGTADAARTVLLGVDVRRYNPFNLLFGDAYTLYVAYARDEAKAVVEPLAAGLHVLANDRIGSPRYPKADRARALVAPYLGGTLTALEQALPAVLGDHTLPEAEVVPESPLGPELSRAIQALCIHTERYGTRSSTFLALGPSGSPLRYAFADGPPCTTPFVDHSDLLR